MRTVLLFVLSGCATTEELISRGSTFQACERRDAIFLEHLANDPAGFFTARLEGESLVLEEVVVDGIVRRLDGPMMSSWNEVRSPARALALLNGESPPPTPGARRHSTLATAGAVLGTITGVLPAASVLAKKDLVTPAFTGGAELPDWQPPEALVLEGKRVRVYERSGVTNERELITVFVTWIVEEGSSQCRREASLSWRKGPSLEQSLRKPARRLRCTTSPARCDEFP